MTLPSAVFALQTPNLGDDLQAMTIAGLSPSTRSVCHRERIGKPQLPDPHTVVMNYWFMSKGFRRAPHPTIHPIFHGFCVGRDEMMKYAWPDYLKKHEPIGCRDLVTRELLTKRGIEAYWSGCITLFLGQTLEPVAKSARKGVFMVDVPPEAEHLIPKELRDRAEKITNYCPIDIVEDPIERWARIARINDRLRHAELVITKRLHTSLPCVGFGTPVVLVVDAQPKNFRRFDGYQDFVPILLHESGKKGNDVDWNNIEPSNIPAAMIDHFETFKTKLQDAMGSVNLVRSPSFHKTVTLEIENPGLGDMPGTIEIDLGTQKVSRLPQFWSDRTIAIDIEAFHAFDRFEMPVSLIPYKERRRIPVGRVCDLVSSDPS